jgi:hypothetical protein
MNADAAFVELAEAKRAVRASRRAFATSPQSAFVRTMRAVMDDYTKARQSGVSREDALRGLELELRSAWPKDVSKFRPGCDACDDTGYVDHVCWDQNRCGRQSCVRHPESQHGYVTVCHCLKGDRFRQKVRAAEDDIAAAVKTQRKKNRGFQRMGS